MKYPNYKYFYPPRPENKIHPDDLVDFCLPSLIAQPKLNGSNCLVFTNGKTTLLMNRHGEKLTRVDLDLEIFQKLHQGTKGSWMVLNGEYLNKNKSGIIDDFNHHFVIFDILVYEGEHLIGKSFQQRIQLLDQLYGTLDHPEDPFLYQIFKQVHRVKSYSYDQFSKIFKEVSKIDIYEGLVLKKKRARLENGLSVNNNSKSQVKVRKATKNYSF